ncbi:MAG: peptidase S41, partial [Helicobacter sp.]|nr:peptidase S41 [Helicobacter sp.]
MTRHIIMAFMVFCCVGLASAETNATKDKATSAGRLEAYNKLRNVMRMIEERYVDEISFNEIVNKAIDGMLSNLD